MRFSPIASPVRTTRHVPDADVSDRQMSITAAIAADAGAADRRKNRTAAAAADVFPVV